MAAYTRTIRQQALKAYSVNHPARCTRIRECDVIEKRPGCEYSLSGHLLGAESQSFDSEELISLVIVEKTPAA